MWTPGADELLKIRLQNQGEDVETPFQQIDRFAESLDIALEGAYTTEDRQGGRAYLAVCAAIREPGEVMRRLAEASLPADFTLIHPVDDE